MTNKTNFEPVILTAINECKYELGSTLTIGKDYKLIDDNEDSFFILNDFGLYESFPFNRLHEYFIIKTDPIVENVVEKIRRRATVGISKYGTTLDANHQDDFLKHLQEELFDASNYVEKLMRDQNTFEKRQFDLFHWFNEKGLVNPETAPKQFMKVAEELGELSSAIIKNDRDKEIDAFGDVLVTIIGLSFMRDLDLVKCLDIAWNEIKDRKGKVIDGSFIKE